MIIMYIIRRCCLIIFGLFGYIQYSQCPLTFFSKNDHIVYKEKIRTMFYEAYGNYVENAIDYDELMPISCSGMNTWGTFSLSLIDTLDMLAIMNNHTEFRRVAQHILDTANFEANTNVSVFETNIRVVGGLLSAHLLSRRSGFQVEEGWPCSGPLLRLAEKVARKLLPAFETPTGMPYGTVNFRYGVPENETPITCTAGVGTFIVEFGTLSRLTGDPIFEEKALNALEALQKYRSKIGLLGNHINILDGKWTATDAGIGAGVDSYFEYLVKGSMLLQMPSLIKIFYYDYGLIKNYLKKNDWFIWVSMITGSATMPLFQSLEAFFPGLLTLIGDIDQAKKSLYNYHQVWKQYGFVPEFYDIIHGKHHKREGYPLRPEFIESVFYLYRATKDTHLLSIGADVVDSIYYSARTNCGYATIKSVSDHTIEDRMESFFLAETLKYLYLLFDEDNFINENGSFGTMINYEKQNSQQSCIIESGGYVFNTEAHPIDIAALYCCQKQYNEQIYHEIEENMDLYDLFFKPHQTRSKKTNWEDDDTSDDNKIEDNMNIIQTSQYISTVENKFETLRSSIEFSKTENFAKNNINNNEIESTFSQQITSWDNSEKQMTETVNFLKNIENETHCHRTSVKNLLMYDHSTRAFSPSIPLSSINQMKTELSSDSQSKVLVSMNTSTIVIETIVTDLKSDSPKETIKTLVQHRENTKFSQDNDYELLSCPSQSFLIRLSLYGQMFE